MLARGTTRYTRSQLSDEFDRLKVSGRVSGPGAGIQTTRPNLEAALVTNRIPEVLNGLLPTHPQYGALRTALSIASRTAAPTESPCSRA